MHKPGTQPGEDGLAICRRLSASGRIPVIMLRPLGEQADRIIGLELGADDYLPKPCSPRELLARVRPASPRRASSRQSWRTPACLCSIARSVPCASSRQSG